MTRAWNACSGGKLRAPMHQGMERVRRVSASSAPPARESRKNDSPEIPSGGSVGPDDSKRASRSRRDEFTTSCCTCAHAMLAKPRFLRRRHFLGRPKIEVPLEFQGLGSL